MRSKTQLIRYNIQSEALDLKVQEIRDELGDEYQPQDKSEINDKGKYFFPNKKLNQNR